ncbi:MAG: hypothetical protein KKF30_03825 [Proteobacteria bacterium]|nr:hypothetical protein [Pseudomonadota bacterium]MBU4470937.1 hypothetical protein [Pseudomonadota bacterium]MCG2753819.1 hypothetical protein [Desulfobacteraceae bacterium]
MIRNISQEEVFDLFFDLIIDIEMGDLTATPSHATGNTGRVSGVSAA